MNTRHRLIGGLVLLVTLAMAGCVHHRMWVPTNQLKPKAGVQVDVLTKGGDVYQLSNALISSYSIRGAGRKLGPGKSSTKFLGEIPFDSIALTQVYHKSSLSTLAGLCVAGVVLAEATDAMDSDPKGAYVSITYPSGGGYYGSCPLALSYDGNQYQLESETYVGAICQSMQRKATDVLKHVQPVGGQYRIKIANESPESHYTDNVRLVAVDHPSGTRLVADALGRLHTISSPVWPIAAIDLRHKDARTLVSATDSVPWETDLQAIDPSRTEDLTDGLVCEFNRPANTRTAKLVVTCVNTDLGDYALAKIFSLRGPGKLGWYHDLNTNIMEQRKLVGWMMREGGIDVSVWQNDHWVRQAVIPGVGSRAWTDRLITLNLSPSGDNIVKVKLEGATGLWRIDAVAVDYSDDAPLQSSECALASATNQNGDFVTSALATSDGTHQLMVTDEWAELIFDTVATYEGMTRSFVLETTGYYYAWFPQNEIDEHELVDRILTEPLFGSKLYMKDYLKTKVQVAGK